MEENLTPALMPNSNGDFDPEKELSESEMSEDKISYSLTSNESLQRDFGTRSTDKYFEKLIIYR